MGAGIILFVLLFCFRIKLSLSAGTCEEAYLEGSTSTGVKTLQYNGYSFKAFCVYNSDGTGWFYPSIEAVTDNGTFVLNLLNQYLYRDQARLRIFMNDGSQKDSTIQQLDSHNFRDLTFMVNSAEGFAGPHNTGAFGPSYLYVGFLDKQTARAKTLQGWKADGRDITFRNCDSIPNSYYAFYPKTAYSSRPSGLGSNYHTTNVWREGVNRLPNVRGQEKIPLNEVNKFKFTVEIHMGGCGTLEVSTDWSTKPHHRMNSNGAALGLKFFMSNSCVTNPCGYHGTCLTKGRTFTCNCLPGWEGTLCNQEINECLSDPCLSNEVCTNTVGSYTCHDFDSGNNHLPATCEEAYLRGSTSTGVKTLHYNGKSFKAFCLFNSDGTGWFYPSKEAVTNNRTLTLNLASQYNFRDQARIRIFLNNGIQKESTLQQINRYRSRPLTFMVNSAAGFVGPSNTGKFSPNYLFVGFLDKNIARARTVQGWKADGRDITFGNCDANPNSYFTFYPVSTYRSRPNGLGSNYHTTNVWRAGVNRQPYVRREHLIPQNEVNNFKFSVEIHMGGCGTLEVSTDWSTKPHHRMNSNGAALGLKFHISEPCEDNPCGAHGLCVTKGRTKGTSFSCRCMPGWKGTFCNEDVNECNASPCPSHQVCTNTVGSYSCTDTDSEHTETSNPPGTCEEAYVRGSTSSGVKILNHNGYSFKAFCIFNSDRSGLFYPSTEAVTNNRTFTLNLASQFSVRDQAWLRIFLNNGIQKESTLQQISQYNTRPLTFMVNSATGFANPANTGKYSPSYLYVGFIDKHTARARTVQGWKADGRDITFRNCDSNPNSYYVFYPKTTYSARPSGLGSNYHTTNVWREGVNRLPNVREDYRIPSYEVSNFKFSVEIHMGGCGTLEVSSDWSSKPHHRLHSNGAALGLKFYMSDECSGNPCGSHGSCVDGVKSFTCKCEEGWTGKTCTQRLDKCTSNPCGHGGQCTNTWPSYRCNCDGTGYKGHNCQTDVNECSSNPCHNNGICVNTAGSFTCDCTGTGYTGNTCQQDIYRCSSNLCQNHGVCINTPGSYTCECDGTGYSGPTCETDVDECSVNKPCLHNGVCVNLPGSYKCICNNPGYWGRHCHLDVNECADNPCYHGGICTNIVGSFSCDCDGTGYTGPTCQQAVDVVHSECVSNPCLNGGTCINVLGVYRCICDGTGYTGKYCHQDVHTEECSSNPCQNNGVCHIIGGSYSCDCSKTGYMGRHCQNDVDECQYRPCWNRGRCTNTVGSFVCNCDGTGHVGPTCQIAEDTSTFIVSLP